MKGSGQGQDQVRANRTSFEVGNPEIHPREGDPWVYEAHFGLSRRPFGETVDPSAFVALASRDAVVRRLRYGLEYGQGPALLFGAPGSGKTLIAKVLAREIGGSSIHLSFPAMPSADLSRPPLMGYC